MGAARVPEAPPSWPNTTVNAAAESPGTADGAESPPAPAVGSATAPEASVAAGAATVPAALVAEDTSRGQWTRKVRRGLGLTADRMK